MPFESSLPLIVTCLLGAGGVVAIWLRMQSWGLLALAAVLAITAIGAGVADYLVVTDRECLLGLFSRLADAAERHDSATLIAALDPDLRPLRDEVESVLKHVRPSEVAITRIDVSVDPDAKPPQAVAGLIVRVTGNVIDKGTAGTVLAGAKVLLHKQGGQWLVKDAEAEQVRPGKNR